MAPSPDGAPLSIPHWGFTPYPSVLNGIDYYGYLNVFTAPSMRQPIKTMAHSTRQPIKRPWLTPKGHRLCEPYQTPDAGRLAPGVSYILPI